VRYSEGVIGIIKKSALSGHSYIIQGFDDETAFSLNLLSSIHISINNAPASTVRIGVVFEPLVFTNGAFSPVFETGLSSLGTHGLVC